MTVMLLAAEDTGGIPVDVGGLEGALVTGPGQLQYGDMLLGGGTPAGWRELVGWRDTPAADVSDTPRPQAHGSYVGQVFGQSLVVTFTYLLRGTPDAKAAALAAIERYAPMDGVERALVVDDSDGPWLRMARVIARQVPQGKAFRHGPVECSLQFLCADPRRYSLDEHAGTVTLPESSGGLEYPLVYPLVYGESSQGSLSVTNSGSVDTPLVVTFNGPFLDPVLTSDSGWSMGFDINLADGESLVVDTAEGTALLNGEADRLYTIKTDSDPLERCTLPPGQTATLAVVATTGAGTLLVSFRDARM